MEKLGAQKIRSLRARDSYALVTETGKAYKTIERLKIYEIRPDTTGQCGIGTRTDSKVLVKYRYNAAGQRIYKKVESLPAEHYVMDEANNLGIFTGTGKLKYCCATMWEYFWEWRYWPPGVSAGRNHRIRCVRHR